MRESDRAPSDEAALFRAAQRRDAAALQCLTERYLPLAKSVATRFFGRGERSEDLIQVASMGLVLAIRRFDVSRGLAFSTFAVPTIVGEVKRHFRDHTWAVHMPRSLQERHLRLAKLSDQIATQSRRSPTVAELAAASGLSEEEVLDALQVSAVNHMASLDDLADDDQPATGVARSLGTSEYGYDEVDAWQTLRAAAHQLSRRRRRVLELAITEDLTQEEIAARVGISQMQVSRDLRAARDHLRDTWPTAIAPV